MTRQEEVHKAMSETTQAKFDKLSDAIRNLIYEMVIALRVKEIVQLLTRLLS